MRRVVCLFSALVLVACGPGVAANSPPVTPMPAVGSKSSPTASASLVGGSQDTVLGPAGMTLQQEIGAVMMVGFKGPLTPAVLEDWRQHQFGGLIVVPINRNAPDAATIRQLIQSVRGVMLHPLMAATNQEGGTVCFLETGVPCMAGARQVAPQGATVVQSELATMSRGLKALGFDINFAPVADVWDGSHPFMSERSYGENPQLVAQDVTAAIAGIHAAGMYAAAKHFPGDGKYDFSPFRAAIAAHVEFVMVGHLNVPSIDASVPTSMSATVLQLLRNELGYQGVIISDDLQTGALSPRFPPPVAAVRFLKNGGDMVVVSHDIAVADATFEAIHAAVLNGSYPRAQLDASVQKLLSLSLHFMP